MRNFDEILVLYDNMNV